MWAPLQLIRSLDLTDANATECEQKNATRCICCVLHLLRVASADFQKKRCIVDFFQKERCIVDLCYEYFVKLGTE